LDDVPGQYERVDRSARIAPASGKDAVTKTRAKQLGREYLAKIGINSPEHFEQTCSTVKTFADRVQFWEANKASYLKGNTKLCMESANLLYLLPMLGKLPLQSVNEDVAQSFVMGLTNKGLGPKTVRTYFGYLRSIMGKKSTRDWEVSLPKLIVKDMFSFSLEQVDKIVGACSGQLRVLVILLALTGTRINEALGLHVEDVDLAKGVVTVRRQVYHGEPIQLKSKKGYREININRWRRKSSVSISPTFGGRSFSCQVLARTSTTTTSVTAGSIR